MTTILTTKLYVPRTRPNVVLRPRLTEQLNIGSNQKLMLISASAGFGKTTLLSEWVAQCEHPVAWLSLNEGDSDHTRFLTYFVSAIKTIDNALGEKTLGLLQSPILPDQETLLTTLINEIAANKQDFILVLDDYHVIDAKEIDTALEFLIENQPPQMHLVISTREDPQLPLSQLRARAHLTELRASDLRFTPEESATFLNQMMGLDLSAENIAALDIRTEGWIAGLQLAALSMQGQSEASNFINSFTGSNRFILDYLLEEVLQQQSESIQNFLLQTSILNSLCSSLCDAVLQTSNSQELLEFIEQANLFIVPLDNDRHWYRYHHLFGDLLRQRFEQEKTLSKEENHALHNRASDWYQENDFVVEAFEHALLAEDLEKAAEILELNQASMDASFQSATWLKLLQSLPNNFIRNRPALSVGYAWALLDMGKFEDCESRLQDAEQALDSLSDKEQIQALTKAIMGARAYHAQALGNLEDALHYSKQVLELTPQTDFLQYGQACSLLAATYWAHGDLVLAHNTFTDAIKNIQKGGNILFAVSTAICPAEINIAQGRLKEAIKVYKSSLQLAEEHGESVITVTANLQLGLSVIYYEQGNEVESAIHLEKSEHLGKQFTFGDYPYRHCLFEAQQQQSLGNLTQAFELLEKAEGLYFPSPLPEIQPLGALKTRILIKQGNLAVAKQWVEEQRLTVDDELSYLREHEHITLARYLLAEYLKGNIGKQGLLKFLERLLHVADDRQSIQSVIEILLLQAIANQADDNLWLEPLARALTLAEPEGYIRIFSNEGTDMQQLLLKAQTQDIKTNYISKILPTFEKTELAEDSINTLPNDSLVETLSKRELEVLKLIAQGLSNQEISDKLFRSLSTIKGHNRVIFAKLLVQNRTEAVAKARELGLL